MFKKWLAAVCLCAMGLGATVAAARDISFQLQAPGGPVTQKSYPGKYLLLTIGYTSCPDICPTTLYEFAQAMEEVQNMDALQPVFVTIDPVNDEIGRLNEYTRFFDERIVGLTGKMHNIEDLARQLGATFGYRKDGKRITNPVKGDSYTVYHSSLIYLIGPDHKLLDVYDYQIGPKGLADALNKALPPAAGKATAPKATALPASTAAAAATPAAAPRQPAATCPLPDGFAHNGQALTLADVLPDAPAGKVTLLNVWASWCAPCRVELPALDKLAVSQQDIKVQTLNLSDKPADVAALFNKMGIRHLPQTTSAQRDLLKRLNAKGLPYTGLFVNGQQVATKSGIIDKTDSIAAYGRCMAQQR